MRVVIVPVLEDNYAYLVIDEARGVAGVVDPAEAEPVLAAAKHEGVKLEAILNTHHHWDHTAATSICSRRCPSSR
jgi:hydroxyacylglutathione hydrolase